ncbi:hypothetical protein HOI18_03005 [Candidatus Uhrbacteria bacterium]|jgi:hypothetical protein|nr:hypothetical protein [Candidatus Uhrbacteria bacterium]
MNTKTFVIITFSLLVGASITLGVLYTSMPKEVLVASGAETYNCELSGGSIKNGECLCPAEERGVIRARAYNPTNGFCQLETGASGGDAGLAENGLPFGEFEFWNDVMGTLCRENEGTISGPHCICEDSHELNELTGVCEEKNPSFNLIESVEELEVGILGFTIGALENIGVFSSTITKQSLAHAPELGDNWFYTGVFSETDEITYRATDPDHVIAREGYYADVKGYEKIEGEYFFKHNRGITTVPIPPELIVEEIEVENGSVLIIKGPEVQTGPNSYPGGSNSRGAYFNTPNGPVEGGVFVADLSGTMTGELFIELMKTLVIN